MNIYLETNAWYEHCDADDVGMPPRDDFYDWTHMAVVWQNIVPNSGPERTNGLKVSKYNFFLKYQQNKVVISFNQFFPFIFFVIFILFTNKVGL